MGWGVHDYPGPPPETPNPICPICGAYCDTYYRGADGAIIGCECDVTKTDAETYVNTPEAPICPECGKACEWYYIRGNKILGCENCIDEVDAWDYYYEMEGL